jgi:hypothetical protein
LFVAGFFRCQSVHNQQLLTLLNPHLKINAPKKGSGGREWLGKKHSLGNNGWAAPKLLMEHAAAHAKDQRPMTTNEQSKRRFIAVHRKTSEKLLVGRMSGYRRARQLADVSQNNSGTTMHHDPALIASYAFSLVLRQQKSRPGQVFRPKMKWTAVVAVDCIAPSTTDVSHQTSLGFCKSRSLATDCYRSSRCWTDGLTLTAFGR